MHRAWLLVAVACSGPAQAPLYKAGDEKDDGAGLLARASSQLVTGGDATGEPPASRAAKRGSTGDPYGGDPYGGESYASWTAPQWTGQPPNRAPRYAVMTGGGVGMIEGVVTWSGPAPAKLATACGVIDNALRLGDHRGIAGAIVYIDRIATGRAMPYYNRPVNVGGVIVKHGCALGPAAQVVVPVPAGAAIHGDRERTRVRIAPNVGVPTALELEAGGVVRIEVRPGVTKVDGEDGRLVAAWLVGLDTPYYAITDDSGRFRIDELAPGTYDVTFWQPPLVSVGATGVLAYGPPIVAHRSIRVDAGRTTQTSVALGR